HLTAYKNLEYIALLNHIPREKIKSRIEEVLGSVGLKKYMHMSVKGFSRGMKQRLGIAQALLKNPEILILDEPTAGVDPEGAIGFKNLIKSFVNEGKTVLLSTHLLHELGDMCNYVVIMKNGRILAQGYIDDLKDKYIEEYGYVYLLKFKKGEDSFIKEMKNIDYINVEKRDSYIRVYSSKNVIEEINGILKSSDILVEEIRFIKPSLEKLFLYYHLGKVVEL
ncbi:MAG TPA: ABC transporter ATP-binding protein, partial [Thermoprotei archaeon]|nr:ABC transporter ATP-binding protein [Thermoprotei archaeon]